MINQNEIYSKSIQDYVNHFKNGKSKFKMLVHPTEDNIDKLPKEAFIDNMLFIEFDFGSENTWVAEQIKIKDNMFYCVLVYKVNGEWIEFKTEFPCIAIQSISKSYELKQRYYNVKKDDKEVKIKIR